MKSDHLTLNQAFMGLTPIEGHCAILYPSGVPVPPLFQDPRQSESFFVGSVLISYLPDKCTILP
jgi:hypothetical protein